MTRRLRGLAGSSEGRLAPALWVRMGNRVSAELQTGGVPGGPKCVCAGSGAEWRRRSFMPRSIWSLQEGGGSDGSCGLCGYGITAPELGYDDYAGLDAKGKIVLASIMSRRRMIRIPIFNGTGLTRYATSRVKLLNAQRMERAVISGSGAEPASLDECGAVARIGGSVTRAFPLRCRRSKRMNCYSAGTVAGRCGRTDFGWCG